MKTKLCIGALVLALIAVAVLIKLVFFPSIKDAYFDPRKLERVPAGLVTVRPTHFPRLRVKGGVYASVRGGDHNGRRMSGSKIPLREVMAMAYGQSAARVLLPPDAPAEDFDFLVTVAGDPKPPLQAAIRRELGYVAHTETRDTDALALMVADARLPGLTVSGPDERQTVAFKDGQLHFTHARLGGITGFAQQFLKVPLVDRTDLTNYYDFAVAWDQRTWQQLENEATARDGLDKIFGRLGLRLQPDTAPVEMLVVEKAK